MFARDTKPGCFDRADHKKEASRQSYILIASRSAETRRDVMDTQNDRKTVEPGKKGEQPPYTTWNQQEIK
jgi:hypothetical protein